MPRRGRSGGTATVAGRRGPAGPAAAGPAATPPRRGWLDIVRDASDLALLGVLTTIGALAVVTLGAAVATASAALAHWRERGHWPSARENLQRYGRSLLPGVPVTLLAAGAAALLTLNLAALSAGTVPGGPVLVAGTALLAAAAVGYAALTVVAVGDSDGWRDAARRAAATARRRPVVVVALAGVVALSAVLAATVIPVATPILVGYLLFALHAVTARLT